MFVNLTPHVISVVDVIVAIAPSGVVARVIEAHNYEEFAMYHTATLIQEIQEWRKHNEGRGYY